MTRTPRVRPKADAKPAAPARRHFAADWAAQVLILLFGYTTLGWTYVVPTGSMENTLMTGDHLVVDHLVYSDSSRWSKHLLPYSEVKRGDIIVFRYPLDEKQNYVKRVVGLPGDRIHMRDKTLYVNGQPLDEPYKRLLPERQNAYMNNFPDAPDATFIYPRALEMLREHVRGGELVVPPGNYFALGDNRDNSSDCRVWGLVPSENIVGKPVFVFWSYAATTDQLSNRTYWLDVARHLFTKTRWERIGRLVRAN